jgi:hypothetical protein
MRPADWTGERDVLPPAVHERLDDAGHDVGRVHAGGGVAERVDQRCAQRPELGGAAKGG